MRRMLLRLLGIALMGVAIGIALSRLMLVPTAEDPATPTVSAGMR